MSDVGYVVAGWSITGVVLLGYWLWLVRRTRRAERLDRRRMTAVVSDRRRRRAIVAIGLCGVAVVAIVVLAVVLSENVVYFRTVSEAVADRRADKDIDRFRIAGKVVPGSVVETAKGVRFRVTDGKATATSCTWVTRPSLFKARRARSSARAGGASASAFDSDRIMIRHGNEYRPPNVDVASQAVRQLRVKASLGVLALALGASAAALGIVVLARGLRRHDDQTLCARTAVRVRRPRSRRSSRSSSMEWALLSHDFSLRYVAENNARATPTALHGRPVSGLRSRDRSSSGCSSSAATSPSSRTSSASRASDPLVAWATLDRSRRRVVLLRARARTGEPVQDAGARRPRTDGDRTRCCRTTR